MAVEVAVRDDGPVEHEDGALVSVADGHLYVHGASRDAGGREMVAVYAPGHWFRAVVKEAEVVVAQAAHSGSGRVRP